MVKYLHYLLFDLEQSRLQAPSMPFQMFLPEINQEEGKAFPAYQPVKLDKFLGISSESLPPGEMLDDHQINLLNEGIEQLWKQWNLHWYLPSQLTERQVYAALVNAMQNEEVSWCPESGATIHICRFEEGAFCPFGRNGGYCYCKKIDDAVKQDLAIWEEHVRSQGLDPYLELSPDEEAAFVKEMCNRNLKKQFEDDDLLDGDEFEVL